MAFSFSKWNSKESDVFVRTIAFHASETTQERMGEVQGVLGGSLNPKTGDALIANIQDTFETGVEDALRSHRAHTSYVTIFESAIAKVNHALERLLSDRGLVIPDQGVHGAIVVRNENNITLAIWGDPGVILLRKNSNEKRRAFDIVSETPEANPSTIKESHRKGFRNIISGTIEDEDIMLVLNRSIRDIIDMETLGDALTESTPETLADDIQQVLLDRDENIALAMLILESASERPQTTHDRLGAPPRKIRQPEATSAAILTPPMKTVMDAIRKKGKNLAEKAKQTAYEARKTYETAREEKALKEQEQHEKEARELANDTTPAHIPSPIEGDTFPIDEETKTPMRQSPPLSIAEAREEEPPMDIHADCDLHCEPFDLDLEFLHHEEEAYDAPYPINTASQYTYKQYAERFIARVKDRAASHTLVRRAYAGIKPRLHTVLTPIQNRIGHTTRTQKVLLISAILLFVMFAISIAFALRPKQEATVPVDASRVIQEVSGRLDSAESSLIYKDIERASFLVQEAETILQTLPQTAEHQAARNDAEQRIAKNKTLIRREVALPAPVTRATIALTDAEPHLHRIIIQGSRWWAVGAEGHVFDVDPQTGSVRQVETDEATRTDIAVETDSGILTGIFPGSITRHTQTAATAVTFPGQTEETIAVDAKTFGARLYILDATRNRILRIPATTTGYGSAQMYMRDATDISDAVSFAIDGYVYVLKADGSVVRLLSGQRTEFRLRGVDPAITDPRRIFVQEDGSDLYILDGTSRVLRFSASTGELVAQYVSPALKDATDIIVDQATRTIIATTPTQILEFTWTP